VHRLVLGTIIVAAFVGITLVRAKVHFMKAYHSVLQGVVSGGQVWCSGFGGHRICQASGPIICEHLF
jgi:hypothetical protein